MQHFLILIHCLLEEVSKDDGYDAVYPFDEVQTGTSEQQKKHIENLEAVTTIENVYYDADNEMHTTRQSQKKSKSIDVVNLTKNV